MAASFHGVLENSSVSLSKAGPSKDFIDQFVTQPPKDLGPHVGNGVVYYFGPQEHRLSAAVTFDLSVRIPDGLYVRLQAAWDGQSVHAQDLPAVFGNYLRVVYADFGLEWKR